MPFRAVLAKPPGHWRFGVQAKRSGIWNPASGKELVRLLSLDGGREWLAATPEGCFHGSPKGYGLPTIGFESRRVFLQQFVQSRSLRVIMYEKDTGRELLRYACSSYGSIASIL